MPWRERAACKGRDVNIFFARTKAGQEVAKAVCRNCPVRRICLDDALAYEGKKRASGRYGVVGGLTAIERAQIGPPAS